jgi:hypothetical protein
MTPKTLGQWCAWCCAVPERQQADRLAQVPEDMRADVQRHLQTFNALREYHARQGRKRGRA